MDENFLKITSIAYRLFDYFPDADPLGDRAKQKILDLSEKFVLFCSSDGQEKERLQQQILEDIDTVLGFLEIGKTQGWASSVNFLIIRNEYRKIKNQQRFFWDKKRTQIIKKPVLNKMEAQRIEASEFLIKFSDRQQKIIEFLKDRERAQVMDLQKVLPTVTKRTIRRDLDELLASGRVVRLGEFNQVFYQLVG